MREIKFRGFNKKKKKMLSMSELLFIRQSDYSSILTDVLEGINKDVVLMQYTGFKINNIEAYEGDIISGRNGHLYEVKFGRGEIDLYHLKSHADDENRRWGAMKRLFDGDMQSLLARSKIEGNIYENPELFNR